MNLPIQRATLCLFPLLLSTLLSPLAKAQDDQLPSRPTSRSGAPSVYVVEAADTPETIALKTLGNEDFVGELLKYNRIEAEAIKPGITLVIPGRERDRSLSALWQANDEREVTMGAGGAEFAAARLKEADILFNASKQAFNQADYQRAEALAARAKITFTKARLEADTNALEDKVAHITRLVGALRFSIDQGVSWKALKQGDTIPVNSRLRSDQHSRAEIQMPDASTFVIDESTEVEFRTMNEDARTGKTDTQLRIATGEIFGNIKPKKKDGSKFYIKNGRTTIVIRGTTIRTNRDEAGTLRAMTLTGSTELLGNNKPMALNAGYGTYAELNKPPHPPIELLPAPTPIFPDADIETTPKQVIEFRWNKIRSLKFAHYKVEIATDPLFLNLAALSNTKETKVTSIPLAAGEYFWRISTIDDYGLQGPMSTPVKFVIEPNFEITLLTDKTSVEKEGILWIAPGTVVHAEPINKDHTSVTSISYSVNNTDFKTYPKGLVLKTDGEYQVSIVGHGATGEKGKTYNRLYRVDGTAPDIELKIEAPIDHPIEGRSRNLAVNISDESAIDLIEVSVNNARFKPYTGRLLLSTAAEHDIRVRATDVFGNEGNRRMVIEQLNERKSTPTFEPNL